MRFPQADTPQKDEVGFVLDKCQAEVVLHLQTVNPGGPVPAELLKGFDDGEAREPDATLGGAIPAHVGRTTQVWDVTVTNEATGRTIALQRCTQMVLHPNV